LVFLSSHDVAKAQDKPKSDRESMPLSAEDAKKLKSPVPYSKKSIARGLIVFRDCTPCHGNDGKATVDVVANATDLTSPKVWKSGTSEGEIFRSIRDGAGEGMPSFKSEIAQEDLWNLVNFIRSLWPESERPPLQDDRKAGGPPADKVK
jgi:mono/diheme cytochrome c family protein